MASLKVKFPNDLGYQLSGVIELPVDQSPLAYAVFAHAFTGNKSFAATRNITKALIREGYGVLRFDLTGLGQSEGDFSDTNFTTGVNDIKSAVHFLETKYEHPKILVGHSLGGAMALKAAYELDTIKAVATVGTPSEPSHVTHLLGCSIDDITKTGKAEVDIAGRNFTIKQQFLDDLESVDLKVSIKKLRKGLLVLHSPQDRVVEIENAAEIYHSAHHPKSFVTLDGADHMLTSKADGLYAGDVIASWARRYIDIPEQKKLKTNMKVVAEQEGEGYTTEILADEHRFTADEPSDLGGNDYGPSPYELLNASLGACTAMTLKMYARRKKWPLETVRVHLNYDKKHLDDASDYGNQGSKIDFFERSIEVVGDLDESQIARLLEIADKCPVHKTLSTPNHFKTYMKKVSS